MNKYKLSELLAREMEMGWHRGSNWYVNDSSANVSDFNFWLKTAWQIVNNIHYAYIGPTLQKVCQEVANISDERGIREFVSRLPAR